MASLYHAVEIISVDGYLVVNGSQPISFSDGIGDERGVVYATWQVALIARENQQMLEVQTAGLQYAHDLNALGGFSMEGNGSGLCQLDDEPFQRSGVHVQVSTAHEVK